MPRVRMATITSAVVALLLALAATIVGMAVAPSASLTTLLLMLLAVVATAGVGLVIGVKVPGQPVGLVLALAALLYSTTYAAEVYARLALVDGHGELPGGDWAALWVNASWPTMFAGVIAVAFLFPDGQLPSPRWRPVAATAAVAVVGTLLVGLFSTEPFDEPFDEVDNPAPALPEVLGFLELVLLAGLAASVVAAGTAARHRYRRAVEPERQQLLWLAATAWLIPVTLAVCVADLVVPGQLDALVLGLLLLTLTSVPGSIAVALLRYRLYELDRLVNRTLVYAALTALVLAAYYLGVVVLGGLLRDRDSLAVSLLTTAVVVVGLTPVRAALQRRVDRFMYGDRADPYAGLSRLASRLEESLTPQMALRTIVETVADSLKVPFVSVDLGSGPVLERVVHGGPEPADPVHVPLTFQGEAVGALVVGPRPGEALAAADHRLIAELARHAGAVVHATKLTLELQRSREELVLAQEEVRRRLRRDLHDELGPALAGAVFQIDLVRDGLSESAADADRQLEVLKGQLQDAVDSVRAMAYSLRPPALDQGLLAAIAEQVSSFNSRGSGPQVTLKAPAALPSLSPAVEVAAYRIAMEAITNAARHSGARSCDVRLSVNGGLQLEVIDDGVAGEGVPYRAGVGITSMRERAGELGATLTIEQGRAGTKVHTVLPIGGQ